MGSRLDQIKEWSDMARRVSYSVQRLARSLDISERQLHRYFKDHFGDSPRHFLETLRMKDAARALSEGGSVKEVAYQVCFKQASHFSRVFKRTLGRVPSDHTAGGMDKMSEMDTKCPN